MNLRAKASSGYAMAALLVAMSVMAILLSVALPNWSQMIRREKEEELIFRGNQYARAFSMYQRKYGVPTPPNLDVLLKERFLRKKYKDPLSPNEDGEFQLLYAGLEPGRGTGPGRSGALSSSLVDKTSGPIRAVASKNTGESIRVLNGKTRYNEWEFAAVEQTAQPGGAAGPAGPPGSRGQPPGSQRGVNPNNPGARNPGAPPGMPGAPSGGGQVPGRGSPGAPPGTIR